MLHEKLNHFQTWANNKTTFQKVYPARCNMARWPSACNKLRPPMLRYGFVEMLRSFGRRILYVKRFWNKQSLLDSLLITDRNWGRIIELFWNKSTSRSKLQKHKESAVILLTRTHCYATRYLFTENGIRYRTLVDFYTNTEQTQSNMGSNC